ncbi:MAG: sigma factor-like helix-turn-helix DNA-binding protein [bacterium]|nr:sigma factor-like helix-turn-helix DNA-binding protein [bacterium]
MADLKTIIHITQERLKRELPVHEAVVGSLEGLPSREADVLVRRTGLRTGKPETLAKIGDELGVTRERIRQIEKQGRGKFAAQMEKSPLQDILKVTLEFIRERGGVVGEETLDEEFLPSNQQTDGGRAALSLLLEASPAVVEVKEDKQHGRLHALSNAHAAAATSLVSVLEGALAEAKSPRSPQALSADAKVAEAAAGNGHLLSDEMVASVLDFGQPFVRTEDNAYGLATWRDINPKNIRDKTLYVMKRAKTPLHFEKITEKIKQAKFDAKPVTVQAVHNELINGDEFVLIGRGIYALKEWGYVPGTVADVIRKILTDADGPVERSRVIEEVLKQRHVSENTILINLQEKSKFKRVGEKFTIAGGE